MPYNFQERKKKVHQNYLEHREERLKKRAIYRMTHREEIKAQQRRWRASDAGRATKKKWRDAHSENVAAAKRKATYGIDRDLFEAMVLRQSGVCKICKQLPQERGRHKTLSVDHDHGTGRIRGLLCETCNRALGLLKDNLNVLRAAVQYLEEGAT